MTAIRPHARGGALPRGRRTFRQWRRSRPFWGGLLLILGGASIFSTTQMSLGGLSFQLGPTGFQSWLIPTILVACGALAWFTPHQRMFYAIVGAVTSVYSLIGVNLGGFFLGMLQGIIGAGLVFAWTPLPPAEPVDGEDADASPADGTAADDTMVDGAAADDAMAGDANVDDATVDDLMAEPPAGGHRAHHRADDGLVDGGPPEVPAPAHRPEVPGAGPSGSGPRLYGIALLVVSLATVGAVALPGGAAPAYAQDCPIEKPTAEPADTKPKPDKPEPADPAKPTPAPSATAAPAPASEEPEDDGNVIEDIVEGVTDGIKDILGIGDDEEEPAAPAEPTPSPSPTAAAAGAAKQPTPKPTGQAGKPAAEKPPKPAVKSVDSIEDLEGCDKEDLQQPGPIVQLAPADGQPIVAAPSLLTGSRVTMFGLSYDGVVDLPTAGGTIAALQFSMDRSVTDDFELVVPDGGGRTTSLKSSALTVQGNVKFYASRFHGKLLGIPLTFTPESPPPITLPIMSFGDPEIDLVFVDCDVLKAPDLVVDPR